MSIDDPLSNDLGTQIRYGRLKLSVNGTTEYSMANGLERRGQFDCDVLWTTASSPHMVAKSVTYSTISIKRTDAVLLTQGPESNVE